MTAEADAPAKPRGEAAVLFVCAAMLIDTISFGLLVPVMPSLIVELSGTTMSDAASIGGWLTVVFAGLQFLCGPLVGNLSDRYGRRPVLLASMAMFAVNYLLMGFAQSLVLIFIGRALTGAAGAIFAPANAYVADVTPPERRAQRFALVGAAFGLGFILGPALGALLGQFGTRTPFFAAAALAGVNFLFGLFVLPESLPKERRRAFDWGRANPLGAIINLRRRGHLLGVIAAIALWNLAFQVYPSTWNFFAILRFNWDVAAIGLSLAYAGLLMVVVQGALTGRVIRAIGERSTAILGMTSGILGMAISAAATQGWMVYAAQTIAGLQGLSSASMNAITSARTPPTEQGELQGAVAGLNGLGAIIGPLVLTQTLSFFTGQSAPAYFPGAAFALSAAIASFGLAIFILSTRRLGAPLASEPRS